MGNEALARWLELLARHHSAVTEWDEGYREGLKMAASQLRSHFERDINELCDEYEQRWFPGSARLRGRLAKIGA